MESFSQSHMTSYKVVEVTRDGGTQHVGTVPVRTMPPYPPDPRAHLPPHTHPSNGASVRSGSGWPAFQRKDCCSPVQDKLLPLASEDNLARGPGSCEDCSLLTQRMGSSSHDSQSGQYHQSKGRERKSLVLFLLPAPCPLGCFQTQAL